MVDGAGNDKVPYVSTSKLKFDASAGGLTVISGVGTVTAGIGSTALIVKGDARITGILTVGEGSLTITSRDINAVGVVTGSNFKTGTTNVHNVGVEAAGINVLGADTPIGTGATVYNSGLIVSKSGAEFQGVVTASSFVGTEGEVKSRGLKYNLIQTLKQQVAGELAKTDWYITRNTEKSTAIPNAISTHRDAVRTKQASMETAITNASDTPALETLYTLSLIHISEPTRPY